MTTELQHKARRGGVVVAMALAGLVAVPVLQGCAVARDQQSVGSFIDDATLTTRVKAKFAEDRSVSAMAGVVQLSGFAKSAEERTKAEELARSVSGVVSVRNDIVLRG